ncbi:SagB/ThcOx family dehydrogenase [Saccharothrix sp. AJ9571]|nr:SagB/ThcOx family dehydrogenase [Saccharothrix sp. AJ9571]
MIFGIMRVATGRHGQQEGSTVYRRARSLVMFWRGSSLVARNYLAGVLGKPVHDWTISVEELNLLRRLDHWRTAAQVATDAPEWTPTSIAAALGVFHERGLLLTPAEAAVEDGLDQHWTGWSPEAPVFLFGTQDADYPVGEDHGRVSASVVGQSGPPPPIVKHYPGPYLTLPDTPPLTAAIGAVLHQRRTHRTFTPEAIPFTDFAAVINTTFAATHFVSTPDYGTLMLRTSPCGGARCELEAYVGVHDVEGVACGLYHYNPRYRRLAFVAEYTREVATHLAYDQDMAGGGAFVVYLTANMRRSSYKYRHPRQLRVVFLNAGHLGQTFALAATAAGLGPWQSAAVRDSQVQTLLGLDPIGEPLIYMMGAGQPATPLDGVPAEYPLVEPPDL